MNTYRKIIRYAVLVVLSIFITIGCTAEETLTEVPRSPTPPPIPTRISDAPSESEADQQEGGVGKVADIPPMSSTTLTPDSVQATSPSPTPTSTGTVTIMPSATITASATAMPSATTVSSAKAAPSATITPSASPVPSVTVQPSQTPVISPSPSDKGGGIDDTFIIGGQTHTLDNPAKMHYAGMRWVKFQHKWSPGQNPVELIGRIEQAHNAGFKVLLSITGQLHPTAIDYQAYVQFVAGVAGYGADGIEVWNEMNLDREWPVGQINPESYVTNMLKPAYNAIKNANPDALIVAGALAPTGVHNGVSVWSDDIYLAGMRDAGAANYMDCLGVHFNTGATSPDDLSGHPADGGAGHYSWYFWGTYNLYSETFPNTDLCYTEIGWVTGEGYGGLPATFWWGNGNTVREQAMWLARSAVLLIATGRTRMMIVFNVDFTHWGDDPQAGYAIIRPNGSCPTCDKLHEITN